MEFMKDRGCSGAMGRKFGGPAEMFRSVMGDALNTDESAKYATQELRTLFEDWLIQLEEEIMSFKNDRDTVTPEEVANEFKISRDSAVFVLSKLAQKGKINFDDISARKR
jgi:predicted HTH transcriptional regulator